MPLWLVWTTLGLFGWVLFSFPIGVGIGNVVRVGTTGEVEAEPEERIRWRSALETRTPPFSQVLPRVLVVDDDASFRTLLHTTLARPEIEVREAESAEEAASLVRSWRPSVLVLDVGLPDLDGLSFCRGLKAGGEGAPGVVLLTGAEVSHPDALAAGADALLRKPFSPLDLVAVLERFFSDTTRGRTRLREVPLTEAGPPEQLDLYARDVGELLGSERAQRTRLELAYRQTIESLATALEWKDAPTSGHSRRVQLYALELAAAVEPALLTERSLEHGFLLHDVGKIAIPDSVLRKQGPLTESEQQLMRRHTISGAELLANIPLLEGAGLEVVRSHHERWDGAGYPDGLAEEAIPLGARVFAVADALDAMTSDRPYRRALSWDTARRQILAEADRQFDANIVHAFVRAEPELRQIRRELVAA
jgi:response regulator RpfG family c-di-GMP phosphodiesterase